MKLIGELLPGCFLLQPINFKDQRGCFVKTYQEEVFLTLGLKLVIREEFYSVSKKNVVRGMHFQLPPHAHHKLVYCTRGVVKDVLLDLRHGVGYGNVATVEISENNRNVIFIPEGIAHGFLSMTDDAMMIYKTSAAHVPESDCGIKWNSFDFDWGDDDILLSERDKNHPLFIDFKSPF